MIIHCWKPAVAVLLGIGLISTYSFAGEFQDEGGAPAQVVLRMKGKAGEKKSAVCEFQYTVVTNGKTVGPINLTGGVNSETTAADDNQSTRRTSFTRLQSKNDTIGLTDAMNKQFASQFNATITSDARGNTLKQTGTTEPPESFNFPTGPVKVGDTWQGWLGKHETKKPITYRLDKIIRFHGDDIAVISKQSPAWKGQDHNEIEWFDVNKGDFIGCTVEEVEHTPQGTTTISCSIFDQ